MADAGSSFDVDEWDGRSSFTQHALAGSVAGLAEHSVMYPFDTVKTLMQVRQGPTLLAVEGGSVGSVAASMAHLHSSGGLPRMWRGVQTMFSGCVPAHAAYFSIYEGCKARLGSAANSGGSGGGGSGSELIAAGTAGVSVALATMVHDVIMTPMDCIKQRLQLGHHQNSVVECACAIMRQEGVRAFMLSYPTTLMMNVPYAVIMGSTNEAIRSALNPSGKDTSLSTYLLAGAGAGTIAAALTNPLDVVKTRLQVQTLSAASDSFGAAPGEAFKVQYGGFSAAVRSIAAESGWRGFWRGLGPRMAMFGPSCAISWVAYEGAKHLLS